MKLSKIAKDYGLKLTFLTEKNFKKISKQYDDITKADAKNNSYYYVEDDHIIIGFYDDKHYKKAAFFHELGHSLINDSFEKLVNYNEILIEYEAWILGLKVARKYNIKLPNKIFKYMLKSIHSYYKDSLREVEKTNKKNSNKNKKLETILEFKFENHEDPPELNIEINFMDKEKNKKIKNIKLKRNKKEKNNLNLF